MPIHRSLRSRRTRSRTRRRSGRRSLLCSFALSVTIDARSRGESNTALKRDHALIHVNWAAPGLDRVPSRVGSSRPTKCNADISRHTARPVDDLEPYLVSFGAEVPDPQIVDFLWNSGQGCLPTRFHHVD